MVDARRCGLNTALWSLGVALALSFAMPAWAQQEPGDAPASFGEGHGSVPEAPSVPGISKQLPDNTKFVADPGVMGQPMLPGAVNGTNGPQGGDATEVLAPELKGETNGTIGPPGFDGPPLSPSPSVVPIEMTPSAPMPLGKIVIDNRMPAPRSARKIGQTESGMIIGGAVSLLALSVFFLFKKKKAAFWTLGAIAAAVLAIAGFAWGSFGLFQ